MEEYESIIKSPDSAFRYSMLGRLQRDCEYYLGYGGRSKKVLWTLDEKEQIALMKELWKSFDSTEKPVWLTWEEIVAYEKRIEGANL